MPFEIMKILKILAMEINSAYKPIGGMESPRYISDNQAPPSPAGTFLIRRRYRFIPIGIGPLSIDEVFPVIAGAR